MPSLEMRDVRIRVEKRRQGSQPHDLLEKQNSEVERIIQDMTVGGKSCIYIYDQTKAKMFKEAYIH